jgi:hypothetical protein
MGEVGEYHLFEPRRLLGDRLGDLRLCVAVNVDPPRRDQVDDLASIGGQKRRALAGDDRDRRVCGLRLREGVPDMGSVLGEQGVNGVGQDRFQAPWR